LKSSQVRQLLEEHVTPVYRFALRLTKDPHVAEELTQETMLRGWKQRRLLTDPSGTKPWLFTIAANLWRDELRRRKIRARAHQSVPSQSPSTPSQRIELSEDARLAIDAIDKLPRRQRDVLYLTACEGLTPTQIGTVLGISAGAAKSTLSLARAKLRERLERELTT
jgi:RNA polymerase sigma-70 factor, ECF subfamily